MVRWVGSNSRLDNVLPWNQPISGGIDTEGMSKFRDLGEGRNLNKISSSQWTFYSHWPVHTHSSAIYEEWGFFINTNQELVSGLVMSLLNHKGKSFS